MDVLSLEDHHHLQAAQGWLELGNHLEATHELEQITPQRRAHPDVLSLRWAVHARAKDWGACVDLAKVITKLTPDQDQAWIDLGNSLYFNGRTQEAYDCVKPVLDRFPKNPILPYNLACYACQLGNLKEAKTWLGKAFELDADGKLKLAAQSDPDLEPLWKDIGNAK